MILARSFVLEDECFLPEGGWWRLIARNSAVSLYGTIYWSALHCWWWSAVIASDPTRGSRHDFPSGRPGRTLLFSCYDAETKTKNSELLSHGNWGCGLGDCARLNTLPLHRHDIDLCGPVSKNFIFCVWVRLHSRSVISQLAKHFSQFEISQFLLKSEQKPADVRAQSEFIVCSSSKNSALI